MGQFGFGLCDVGADTCAVAVDDNWGNIEDQVVQNSGRVLVLEYLRWRGGRFNVITRESRESEGR